MVDTKTDTGGLAFSGAVPVWEGSREEGHYVMGKDGMTLLDHFAGQALAGVWANPNMIDMTYETIAKNSYAQAMIEEKRRLEK